MTQENRESLCLRVVGTIRQMDARLKAGYARLDEVARQIRDAEGRVERQHSKVQDLLIPSLPARLGKPARAGGITEEHVDLMMEINRVNRLAEAQAILDAEMRNLEILKSKIPVIERSIEDARRLYDESSADFSHLRCAEVTSPGDLRL